MAGTELAKAYVQIIPSADGIKGKLTSALGGEASAAGDSAGLSIGSAIKKAIAAAGIGTALKSAISEGANLQQSLGGIETLFKDSADIVIKNAQNAYKTAGLSANEYMESVTSFSASLLQGLAGDTNKAATVADMALTDMSDNANKMGTSMELIQNTYQGFAKQNYTMLDNLKLGYGGTKTEMQRLLADATKLSGVQYDMSNLSDVYEAIHVIQEEMGITGTTAKEAASTFSGSLASMKSAFSNVLGNLSLGEDIGPSLSALSETVFTFVAGNLVPMVGNILSSLPEVLDSAFSMAIRGLNLMANNADVFVQNGIELLGQLATGIISALPYLAEAAVNIGASLGTAIINTDWLSVATEFVQSLRDAIGISIGEIFGADDTMVNELFGFIIDGISGVAQTIQDAFSVLWEGIQYIWETVGVPIFDAIMSVVQFVAGNWSAISGIFLDAFQVLWDLCNEYWESIGKPIWDAIGFAIGEVQEIFAEYMPLILEFVQNAMSGIKDTWENHLKPVFDAIGKFLNDVLKPAFEFVFDTIIRPLVDNVFGLIVELWNNTLKPVFDGICDFLLGAFSGDWETAFQGIIDIVSGIWEGLVAIIEAPINTVKDIVSKAIEFIQDKFDFDWSLPELKLPHFNISGGEAPWGFGGKGTMPSIGIEWYAKAMNEPMIMNSPTAFGINSLGQIMAGGEAGSEVVSGTATLMKMIATAVASQNNALLSVLVKILDAITDMDENMAYNLRKALEGLGIVLNDREFARLVKAVK